MASSKATTAAAYLAELPEGKRAVISAVRDVVNEHLPAGYVEGMLYGMIAWYVPLERYPNTYNGQPIGIGGLAAQKQYNALYLTSVYKDVATVRELANPIRDQIEHFFAHYKDLEKGKWVKIEGWHGPQDARRAILEAVERYAQSTDKPHF